MASTAVTKWEYRNDFFAITIREVEERPGSYLFTCGLSLPRFNPIIWGRTGICSNAAFKGLQQLRADVSYFALQRGVVTKNGDETPLKGRPSHGWYQESALLFEDAAPGFIDELLAFSSRNLVQTILTASHPEATVPAGLDPKAMQRFLESYGVPNYREVAPPPIAKPQAA